MHDLRTVKIPKICDAQRFESLCRDLWKNKPDNDPVSLNGRRGQEQDGVDVYGRNNTTGKWFGIQCKVRSEGNPIRQKEIRDEVEKAKKFNPSLSKYLLCTTLKRDASLQKIEREVIEIQKNVRGSPLGYFSGMILRRC